MNVYDSVLISESLEEYGYKITDDIKKADLILFNTCAIRSLSEHKAISELGATRKLKHKNPKLLVGIIGCVAQKLGEKIVKKLDFVDFVLGTKDMYQLPKLIQTHFENSDDKTNQNQKIIRTNLDYEIKGFKTKKSNSVSAFITVVRGCTNFCSYCIVPFVRGKENSRSLDEIYDEASELVKSGVKEIVLLGQNVNIYGVDINEKLENVLVKLNGIGGLERLRFVTSHPKSVTQDFLEKIKNLSKVCEHIHIPFQSGSNKILKSMNRQYTREEYFDKIQMIRNTIPNVAITGDVIVGYPGETGEDFAETLDLLKKCELDNIYSFKYSPREGTVAYKNYPDEIPKEIKEARLSLLHETASMISKNIHDKLKNTSQEILWENVKVYETKKMLEGRTRNYKKVFANFKDDRIGKLDKVRIYEISEHSLIGEIVEE